MKNDESRRMEQQSQGTKLHRPGPFILGRVHEVPKPSSSEPDHAFHGTLLTKRQWDVLRYRARGMTQQEVARKFGTSREDVSIIEHHARAKLQSARATLSALQQLERPKELIIPSGTSVFEALSLIILRADIIGIKLRGGADDLLALIRSKCKGRIRGHHLTSAVAVEVRPDGRLVFGSRAD